MKRQFKILLLIFLGFDGLCQNNSGEISKTIPDTIPIELSVKLSDDLSKIKPLQSCGVFQPYEMTFKYDVVKVISGKYKAKAILINLRCPRELIENRTIENGKTYIYKLRPNQTQDNKAKENELEYEIIK